MDFEGGRFFVFSGISACDSWEKTLTYSFKSSWVPRVSHYSHGKTLSHLKLWRTSWRRPWRAPRPSSCRRCSPVWSLRGQRPQCLTPVPHKPHDTEKLRSGEDEQEAAVKLLHDCVHSFSTCKSQGSEVRWPGTRDGGHRLLHVSSTRCLQANCLNSSYKC